MVEVMSSGEEAATSTPVAGETSVAPSHPTHHELQRESQVKRFEAIGGLLQAVEDRLLRVPPEEVASWSTSETATTSQHIADHLRTKGWGSDSHLVEGSVTLLQGAITQEKAIQHLWEQDFGQEKAQQQAATWLEASFARTHPDAASLQIDEKVQEQLRVERVLGGIAISNIPTEIFAQIAVASMDHNGQKEEDRDKIVDALVNMPGVAITVPIKDFLPEDQVREDISDAYVVLVKEGPRDSMQAALRHEVHGEVIGALMERAQQEIPVLADYARRFGEQSEVRSPMAKAISDLAARTAEGDVDITVASLGISRAFAEEHPEKVAVLDRLVQTAREKVTSGSEEERTAFARMILGGMINSERLLEYVDPDNTTKPTDLGALFKETFSLTSVFSEGRFIYRNASLQEGQLVPGTQGTYRIRGVLSSGGFGTTYIADVLAPDGRLAGRRVVIKEANYKEANHGMVNRLANQQEAERFFDEVKESLQGGSVEALIVALREKMRTQLFDIYTALFNSITDGNVYLIKDPQTNAPFLLRKPQAGVSNDVIEKLLREAIGMMSQEVQGMKMNAEYIADSIQNEYTAGTMLRGGPGVPQVYELVSHKDAENPYDDAYKTIYFVQEYIQGRDVESSPDTVVMIHEVLNIIMPVLSTLSYAHQKKVVHKDVKPRNIVRDANGEAFLIDWGLATGPGLSTRIDYGTPEFSPPNIEGLPGADVYAIGVTLYRMLTGKYPYYDTVGWDSSMLMLLPDQTLHNMLANTGISPEVANVIVHSLQANKDRRYANAGEMQMALRKALRRPAEQVQQALRLRNIPMIYQYMSSDSIKQQLQRGELPETILTTLEHITHADILSDSYTDVDHVAALHASKVLVEHVADTYGVRKFDLFGQWWHMLEVVRSQEERRGGDVLSLMKPKINDHMGTIYMHILRHPSDMRYLLAHVGTMLEQESGLLENVKGVSVTRLLEAITNIPEIQLSDEDIVDIVDLWESALLISKDTSGFVGDYSGYVAFAERYLGPEIAHQRIEAFNKLVSQHKKLGKRERKKGSLGLLKILGLRKAS